MKENLSEELYRKLYTTCANAIHNVAKKVIPNDLQIYPTSSAETVYSYSNLEQKKSLAKEALTLLSAVCNMKVCNKLELNILNDIYDKTMIMDSKDEGKKLSAKYEYLIINTCELLTKLLNEEGYSEDQESSCTFSSSTEQNSMSKKFGVFSSTRPVEFREFPSIESFLYNDENKLRKYSMELKRDLKEIPLYQYSESSKTSEGKYDEFDEGEISGSDINAVKEIENLSIHYFEVPSTSIPNMNLKSYRASRPCQRKYTNADAGKTDQARKTTSWQEAHNQELSDLVKCLVQTVAYMKGKTKVKPHLPEREPIVLPYTPSAVTAYSEKIVDVADHGTSPFVETPAESEKEFTMINPNKPNQPPVILRNSASQTVEPGEPIVAPKIYTFFLREGDPTFHNKLPMGPPIQKPRIINQKCSTADVRSSKNKSKADAFSRKSEATVNTIPSHEDVEFSKAFYGLGLDLKSRNSDDTAYDRSETDSNVNYDLSNKARMKRAHDFDDSNQFVRCREDSGVRMRAIYKKHNQILSRSVQKDVLTDSSDDEVMSIVEETVEPSEPVIKPAKRPERDEWEKIMTLLQQTAQKQRPKSTFKPDKNDVRNVKTFQSPPSISKGSRHRLKPDAQEKQLINAADKILSKLINEDLLKIYEERRLREIESELGTDDDDDDHPPILP